MGKIVEPGEYNRPPGSSARTLFIVSSNVDKVNPATRKLIRSHVMQGKKRKRGLRSESQGTSRWSSTASHAPPAPFSLGAAVESSAPLLPPRVGSDLSFIQFADEIEPSMALSIVKFSTIATRVMFPLMMAIGFRTDTAQPLGPIAVDAALLHITAFAVDGFIQRIMHRRESWIRPPAMLHLQKGLRILQRRLLLEDDATMLLTSTINAVVKLADASHFEGDYSASKQHMDGLRKIIDLKGGLKVFGGTKLLIEVLRCDLRVAILSNSTPVFYCQPSEPIPDYPKELLASSNDMMSTQDNTTEMLHNLDRELATAWRVMRRFCLLVNLGTQAKRLIYPEYIHETMISVTYRLLNMSFAIGSVGEAVRLGLMAFSHHVFLQWQDIKLPHYPFLSTHRDCILGLDVAAPSGLILWLLMTAVASLFNVSDEVWLRDCLRNHVNAHRIKTWKELQEILKTFMWIALLDDEPGRQAYDLVFLEQEKKQ